MNSTKTSPLNEIVSALDELNESIDLFLKAFADGDRSAIAARLTMLQATRADVADTIGALVDAEMAR